MIWKPHVTVAAVLERDNRFLLVEEETPLGLQFNQRAGHFEESEDLIAAVQREVFEETAWRFEPEAIISLQLWRKSPEHSTFLRLNFTGHCHSYDPHQTLDTGIVATHWLTRDELAKQQHRCRSPLVLASIDDYVSGQRYPLSLLKNFLAHE